MKFAPSQFFDLSKFAHPQLFNEQEPVWNSLKKISSYLAPLTLGAIMGEVDPDAHLVNPKLITIGKGSVVEAGAYIKGPCIIGKNCQIRHGSYIRGNVVIGDNCVIGHATELKNAIFLDGAQAGHFAYVGDSILGNGVNLGAGTKCANLRFDHQNILIIDDGEHIDTGMHKFGTIFGDGAQTGCNVVTNPGTLMGKQSAVAPCCAAHGVIAEKSVVKAVQAARIV